MGAGHVHALFVHGHSRLHRVPAQCKIAALVAFVLAVVSTPREAFWAYGVFALVVLAAARLGSLPLATLLRRLLIEVPFLAFALFLPIVGRGERVDVLGLSLSVDGLWGSWNILAKGTIGVAASVVVAATTAVPEILAGLDRLHAPRLFTAIAGFMIRYLDVTTAEAQRMSIARQSRGYDPRWFWQVRAVATSAGTLFIRSYERGERVHLAMVSRGYDGTVPRVVGHDAAPRDWLLVSLAPVLAAITSVLAWALVR